MWIEIDLCLPQEERFGEDMDYKMILNTRHIAAIHRISEIRIDIITSSGTHMVRSTDIASNAVWGALQVALNGQECTLDEWGYIRPLIHEQREALYKYMLYQETIARTSKDIG